MAPFFSIGVTTYRRRELLKETLTSIAGQTFREFEVIVGNDYPKEPVSEELLDIWDPRIRYINHPRTLGELGNTHALLAEGRGRYFTWLADDDLYAPNFLEAVHSALVRFDFPPCVFTSYAFGSDPPFNGLVLAAERDRLMSGREFLRAYLEKTVNIQGCYGVFDIQYLRRIGGMEQLGNGFSPYSDVLLGIRAGSLERVVYIDAPLVFFRAHSGSISLTSGDVEAYCSAQRDLCRKSVVIFRSRQLSPDFRRNLDSLLRWCVRDFVAVVRRSRGLTWGEGIRYLAFLVRYVPLLGCSIRALKFMAFLARLALRTGLRLRVDRRRETRGRALGVRSEQ